VRALKEPQVVVQPVVCDANTVGLSRGTVFALVSPKSQQYQPWKCRPVKQT